MNLSLLYGIIYTALTHCFHSVEISGSYFSLVWFHDLLHHSLTHWSNLFGNSFRLLIWELIDATPTNNRSFLPRTTVTLSQSTLDCICRWAVPLADAEASASIALRIVGSHKPHRHYKADDCTSHYTSQYEKTAFVRPCLR